MRIEENTCIDGIERRGRVYYMRIRVPKRFAEVEARREVNQSLRTQDYPDAKARFAVKRQALLREWEARLSSAGACTSADNYTAAMSLLDSLGFSYKPMEQLIAGRLDDLVERIEKVGRQDHGSALAPAALGTLDVPPVRISEMPEIIEKLKKADISAKNARQLWMWRNKYIQAAASFAQIVADRPIVDISEKDALRYRGRWKQRRDDGEVTTEYVTKKLRFVR
ncbi:hypothetical protein ROJ8625_02757 [Roseivivax jejudonensis]|uniref:DUF6538 domain-containing protein n=1 Tax=Roseivivax jejudonensis TaxID=1529041 RepID=A0A1X6ZLN5_9RHOB|nr:DUF6538 domain-containing protein [Roseivivax jejudonensis]SLN55191.1 hypothetical protein ROJ8625_02757 [Roseivivax jejudonensis]